MGTAGVVWIIIIGAAILVDVLTSNFFFVCFSVGAVFAIIAYYVNYSIGVQILIFTAVSILCIVSWNPVVRRIIKKSVPETKTYEQSRIGRKFRIEKDINVKALMKIDGIYWTVKNTGEPVKCGDMVEITGIQGNKINIKKIEEEK